MLFQSCQSVPLETEIHSSIIQQVRNRHRPPLVFPYHLSDSNWRPAGAGSIVHLLFHLPSEMPKIIDSPQNDLSNGLVPSYWSSVTLLHKLLIFWEGWVCFVGMSALCHPFWLILSFSEMKDAAVHLPFHSLPHSLLCWPLTKYSPHNLFLQVCALLGTVNFNQKSSCGLSRYEMCI